MWNLLNFQLAPAQFVASWLPSPWERPVQQLDGEDLGQLGVLELLVQPNCSSSL